MKIAVMGEIHPDGWKIFEENNLESFELLNFEENNLKKELSEVDAILLRTARLSNDVLSYCNKLKIISRHGVGYDNVNVDYLNKKNIALGITSTSNAVSVAEHVLTSFLYLSKNIHLSDKLIREGKFNDKSSLPNFFELYQKNIVIFGFGRIGKAVAKRCLGFEANVYVYDPFVSKDVVEENNCKVVDKTNGLKIADDKVSLTREIDGGKENISSNLPLVIGGQKGLVEESELRIPNMRGIMQARTKPLQVIESSIDENLTISSSFEKPAEKGTCKLVSSDNVEELVSLLHNEAKVI